MNPNPMMDILRPAGQVLAQNPLAGILNSLRTASNPIAILQNLATNNPPIQTTLNIIQQNGGNAQRAFFAEAQKQGLDPMLAFQQAQAQAQSMMR